MIASRRTTSVTQSTTSSPARSQKPRISSGVIGVNAPADIEELPVLSLVRTDTRIPLRDSMARGVVVAAEMQGSGWLDEGTRVLLRGRRLVVEREHVIPPGMAELAAGDGLWLGEKR